MLILLPVLRRVHVAQFADGPARLRRGEPERSAGGDPGAGAGAGAYASEIFRAAIQAIPYGQIESAKAFGLHGFGLFRRVTLPIMAPYAMAGMANLWINLIKDSALISVVGTNELLYTAKQGAVRRVTTCCSTSRPPPCITR